MWCLLCQMHSFPAPKKREPVEAGVCFLVDQLQVPSYSSLEHQCLWTLLPPVLSQNGCNGRNSVTGKPKIEVLMGIFLLVLSHMLNVENIIFYNVFCERGFTVSSILTCAASQKFLENLATDMQMKCIWLFSSCLEEMRKQLFICERRKWSSTKYPNLCGLTWVYSFVVLT